jgi:hypothetical protein
MSPNLHRTKANPTATNGATGQINRHAMLSCTATEDANSQHMTRGNAFAPAHLVAD